MKDRILEFLRKENKTSAQFADEIGVQPSGISHILSGRNKPSLDFILKMLEKYRYLSIEWLLFGTGEMYREQPMQDLFASEQMPEEMNEFPHEASKKSIDEPRKPYSGKQMVTEKGAFVKKIVWFYSDKTFEEYYPGLNENKNQE